MSSKLAEYERNKSANRAMSRTRVGTGETRGLHDLVRALAPGQGTQQREAEAKLDPSDIIYRHYLRHIPGISPVQGTQQGEADPYGKGEHESGAKLDAGKAPVLRGVLQYFPRALRDVSLLSLAGANKYTWKGWEDVPDGVLRYGDALARHLLDETREDYDSDTGLLHATAVAWNALARLELILREKENNETEDTTD